MRFLAPLAAAFALAALPAVTSPATLLPPKPERNGMIEQAQAKTCRREPIWGFRISAFCKPTGICPDRVIKGYRTVCS